MPAVMKEPGWDIRNATRRERSARNHPESTEPGTAAHLHRVRSIPPSFDELHDEVNVITIHEALAQVFFVSSVLW